MPSKTVTTLAAIRGAIGASAWLAPIAAGKLFGIDGSKDVSAALYLRLGGSRDFALAAGPVLTNGSPETLKIAGACDIGDIVAVLIALRRNQISRFGAVLFIGTALGCLGLVAKEIVDQR